MEDLVAMLSDAVDSALMDDTTRILIRNVYGCLPAPPVSTAAPLSNAAAASPSPDGADRISALPDAALRAVVSRLPATDAARTSALSTRWRRAWHSAPLALADAHLPNSPAAAVSAALAAHPGPVRCLHLVGIAMAARRAEVTLWLRLLAAKDAEDLVLVNRPTPIPAHLPLPGAALFACTALTRLYLGYWRFPYTATLPPAAVFPCLRELGLCSVAIDEWGLAFLLEEKLVVVGSSSSPVHIRVRSSSLRCIQVCSSIVPQITVGHASVLERLLLWGAWGPSTSGPWGVSTCTSLRIKIGYAPNLRFLGFLVPGMHQLEIGNTVITAGTKASANITVPSVQMLAILVQLGTHVNAMMLPSFLRCFPNTETLYIQSQDDDIIRSRGPLSSISGNGKLDLKFWEEADPIECVQQHIKKVILRGFQGRRSELDFLKFIAERAQVLEEMVVEMAHGFSESDQVGAKLNTVMSSAKWANGRCKLVISPSPLYYEGKGPLWCYKRAFDRSIEDPFDASKCVVQQGKCPCN